jgi:7-cyano-7-deazaguanine synthase
MRWNWMVSGRQKTNGGASSIPGTIDKGRGSATSTFMKTILLFSGGLDSTTLLYKLLSDGHEVECLAFSYGQKHSRELISAREIAEHVNVPHRVIELLDIWRNHTAVFPAISDVIPNRNMIFLSIAGAVAIEQCADAVAWGPNKDDWGEFPDCREQFAEKMASALGCCHETPIKLLSPLIGLTKAEVVEIAYILNAPVGETWSCYEGGRKPCRKCAACVTRAKAISQANT